MNPAEPEMIVHPRLGAIRAYGPPCSRTWETGPVRIGAFGYAAPIEMRTHGEECGAPELELMESVMDATEELKALVARHLLDQYREYERPAYRKLIGSRTCGRALAESDLPDLREPADIWQLITGLAKVSVERVEGVVDLELLFRTTFDTEHAFQIRFRDGVLYETGMMDWTMQPR